MRHESSLAIRRLEYEENTSLAERVSAKSIKLESKIKSSHILNNILLQNPYPKVVGVPDVSCFEDKSTILDCCNLVLIFLSDF